MGHAWGDVSLWDGPRGAEAIISRVRGQGNCPGTATQMLNLDDESYLLDVDNAFGVPPFEVNQTTIDTLYRSNPDMWWSLPGQQWTLWQRLRWLVQHVQLVR